MKRKMHNSKNREKGSVLIMIICMIAMLGVFSVAINRQVSQEMMFGRWLMDRTVTLELAKAGVERALYEIQMDKLLSYDTLNEDWASNASVFKNKKLGDGDFSVICDSKQGYDLTRGDDVRYGACDEAARLNLNKATEDQLKWFLKALDSDIPDNEVTGIAQSIIDWRDGDDAVLPQGAEANYYKALSKPYEPRNGDLESVEELLLIKGVTSEIYKKMKPFVTVYTDGKVNFNTAPVEVLQGLGLSAELAGKVMMVRKGPDQITGTKDDVIFQSAESIASSISAGGSLSPEEFAQISNAVAQGSAGVLSNVFRIYSLGRLIRGKENPDNLVTCVIDRKGKVFYWKEGR